jgi:hypothetical protein
MEVYIHSYREPGRCQGYGQIAEGLVLRRDTFHRQFRHQQGSRIAHEYGASGLEAGDSDSSARRLR